MGSDWDYGQKTVHHIQLLLITLPLYFLVKQI